MQLPKAPSEYDAGDQAQLRGILEREDKRNTKVGAGFDVIALRDAVTGVVRNLTIANGVIVIS